MKKCRVFTTCIGWSEVMFIFDTSITFLEIKKHLFGLPRLKVLRCCSQLKTKLKKKSKKTGETISSETILAGRFIEFLDLTETCDDRQNIRLKSQKGRFTKALDGTEIETNISNFVNRRKEIVENENIILAEIVMPDKVQDDCMAFLETKKITHGDLFPDYAGAVEICKIELGLDNVCCSSKLVRH